MRPIPPSKSNFALVGIALVSIRVRKAFRKAFAEMKDMNVKPSKFVAPLRHSSIAVNVRGAQV